MSDIVERLRHYDRSPRLWTARLHEAGEAADEIERLRALLAEAKERIPQWTTGVNDELLADISRALEGK